MVINNKLKSHEFKDSEYITQLNKSNEKLMQKLMKISHRNSMW